MVTSTRYNSQDARCIERELREAFPGEKFKVTFYPFSILVENGELNVRKIRRVVDQWFKCAYGAPVKWGRVQRLTK